MEHVVLVIHLILALAIIGLVLLQRSEGGGLGIGGGGAGGLATPGGAATALSKVTAVCAFCFFGTSLVLGILAGTHGTSQSILDELDQPIDLEINVMDDMGSEDLMDVAPPVEESPSVPVE